MAISHQKQPKYKLWLLLCVAVALVGGIIFMMTQSWQKPAIPQERVEEHEIKQSYIKDALPEEELTEIIFWSGDTPISITKEEDIDKIQECIHSMKGEKIENSQEVVPAGFVKIELVYQQQTISFVMQSKRINVDGTRYKVEDASPLIDMCRNIAILENK